MKPEINEDKFRVCFDAFNRALGDLVKLMDEDALKKHIKILNRMVTCVDNIEHELHSLELELLGARSDDKLKITPVLSTISPSTAEHGWMSIKVVKDGFTYHVTGENQHFAPVRWVLEWYRPNTCLYNPGNEEGTISSIDFLIQKVSGTDFHLHIFDVWKIKEALRAYISEHPDANLERCYLNFFDAIE